MDPARTATIASARIRGRTPLKATISTKANGQHDDAFANYQASLWKYVGSKQRVRNAFRLLLHRRRDRVCYCGIK
jgi:hypothetical protein